MNRLTGLLSLFYILGTLILVCSISLLLIRRVPDIVQVQSDRLVPVYSTKPVDQSFVANHNGLNSILIFLKNRSLLNIQPLNFDLYDTSGRIIREIKISGRNIGDGETVRFQFEPIKDSKSKMYTLVLSAPQTIQSDVPVEVGFSNSNIYPYGSSLVLKEPGDMSFQTFFRPQSQSEQTLGLFTRWQDLITSRLVISIFLVSLVFTVTAKLVGFRYN